MRIVVVYHVAVSLETAIVIKAALRAGEKTFERSCPIALVWRAICLKVIDSYFGGSMHIPTGLGKQWWNVAGGTTRLAGEKDFPSERGFRIKVRARGFRGRN